MSFIMCLFIKTKITLYVYTRRKRLHEQGIPFQNACGNYSTKDESHDLYLALNRDRKSLETLILFCRHRRSTINARSY